MARHGNTWKTVLMAAIGVAMVIVVLRGCVVTPYLISSDGMENTLFRGERILVNRWSFGLRLPLMQWLGYHRWGDGTVQRHAVVVFNNPANRDEPVISRREVFVGRCSGLPGDTLMADSLFNICPGQLPSPDQKFLYTYPYACTARLDSLMKRLGIPSQASLNNDTLRPLRCFSRYEAYLLQQALPPEESWLRSVHSGQSADGWHLLVVPARGKPVRVTPYNAALLCNTLVLHENRKAELRGDTLYVDGRPAGEVTFSQDYYWVTSDNVAALNDSRLFGFVPHSHLIGRAARIGLSKQLATGPFSGWRWHRTGLRIY